MFLEYSTFQERLALERKRRNPRKYDIGKIYAVGGDNRIIGKEMKRDKVLGREVRMDLTSSRPHIKREAHPDAAAACQTESTGNSRWAIKARYERFLNNNNKIGNVLSLLFFAITMFS